MILENDFRISSMVGTEIWIQWYMKLKLKIFQSFFLKTNKLWGKENRFLNINKR